MKYRLSIILLLSAFCLSAQTKYTDAVLFGAYMRTDMKVWDKYLHSVKFESLSNKEKARYINYEYGYVATAIDEKAPDAEQHLKDFESHIEALKPVLPQATILDYESSCAAYKALMNKAKFISYGLESFNKIKEAFDVDSLNPYVLTLKGNVDFYAPKAFGGNKKRALSYFYKAQRIFEQKGDTVNNWNYVSARLCSIQCEEKLGNLDKAVSLAKKLLARYPDYAYLRDTYLPELLEKQAKKKK